MITWLLLIILLVIVAVVWCWWWQRNAVTGGYDFRPILYTIGHSTTPIDKFVKLLVSNHVEVLVDVRTLPGSKHNPQFNAEALQRSLDPHGILYMPMPALGGLRKPQANSVNTGWHNKSFRAYADYMQTPEFDKALKDVIQVAELHVVCIMCSEAVPWRCHRSLISDALTVRGWDVKDIIGEKTSIHKMTPFARVSGVVVTYPAEASKN